VSSIIIELRCRRVPKEHVYNGEIAVLVKDEAQRLLLPFGRRDLGDVGVVLHHLVRAVAGNVEEFAVRMVQSAPGTKHKAVPMDLTPAQVQKIYESEESARLFFAPRFITRKVSSLEDVQKVIKDEAERASDE